VVIALSAELRSASPRFERGFHFDSKVPSGETFPFYSRLFVLNEETAHPQLQL
jgi:hypothetical protein